MEQMSFTMRRRRRTPLVTETNPVRRRRPGNYDDTSYLDVPAVPFTSADDSDFSTLYWKSNDFCSSYSISLSNPDWHFLDTWYRDEVKTLLDMNTDSPLADSLLSYLRARIDC